MKSDPPSPLCGIFHMFNYFIFISKWYRVFSRVFLCQAYIDGCARTFKVNPGLPLWLSGKKVCLPMQETWVRSLVQEDLTCCRATKPVDHNYWACAPGPGSHSHWSAHASSLCSAKKKPPQWEACALQLEGRPCSAQLEKSLLSNKDPA